MAGFEHIKQLIAEVGPILDPLEIRWYEEQTAWLLVFSEQNQIEIAYDELMNRVVFSVDLGPARDDSGEDLYWLLLRVGYLWRENGGIRMAMDGEDHVAMLFEHPADSLDIARLQLFLTNFAAQAEQWRELIASEPGQMAENAASVATLAPWQGIWG